MIKHLTKFEIEAYASSPDSSESAEAGRHLLQCETCRTVLPVPTKERFLEALFKETEFLAEVENSQPFTSQLFPALARQWRRQSQVFLWSGAALLVFLCVSFLIWRGAARQAMPEEAEIAEVFAPENNQPLPPATNGGNDIDLPLPPLKTDDRVLSPQRSQSVSNGSAGREQNLKIESSKDDFNSATPKGKIPPRGEKTTLSATRGANSGQCGAQEGFNATVMVNESAVVLKWEKIPNAAKYHLYVSDEDEILIDEFETGRETSYTLQKPLDPLKTYKWRAIITLGNGRTLIWNSRKFTIKDVQPSRKKSERKDKSEIRCSESK